MCIRPTSMFIRLEPWLPLDKPSPLAMLPRGDPENQWYLQATVYMAYIWQFTSVNDDTQTKPRKIDHMTSSWQFWRIGIGAHLYKLSAQFNTVFNTYSFWFMIYLYLFDPFCRIICCNWLYLLQCWLLRMGTDPTHSHTDSTAFSSMVGKIEAEPIRLDRMPPAKIVTEQCTAKNVMYCYILVLSSIKHHQPLLDAICKTSSCLNDPWPMIVQYCTASPFFNWPLEISWLPDTLELAYWAPLRSWTSVALWMGNKWLFIIHYSILFIILQYCRNIGTLQHPTTYNKA